MSEALPTADDGGIIEPVVARRRKVEEADMDITPMIDMTFLLLIFFMVSSKIAPKQVVELPKAFHGDVVSMKNAVVLTVSPGEPLSRVYKGDEANEANLIPGSTQEEQDNRITDVVQDTATSDQKTFVVIQAAKGLKHREVARVAKAAARAEGITQMFVAVMEKKK